MAEPQRECPLIGGPYVSKDHFDAAVDGLQRRFDRFEERMDGALRERPGREEVAALIGKATAEAVLATTKLRNSNGNGARGSAWWDQWGRVVAVILTVTGAVGAGVAAWWQAWQKTGP